MRETLDSLPILFLRHESHTRKWMLDYDVFYPASQKYLCNPSCRIVCCVQRGLTDELTLKGHISDLWKRKSWGHRSKSYNSTRYRCWCISKIPREFLLRNTSKQRKSEAFASELNCLNSAHFRPYVHFDFENILTGTRFNDYAFPRSNIDPIRPEGCTARENTKTKINILKYCEYIVEKDHVSGRLKT